MRGQVAVIGGGVAGVVAAYLLQRRYRVDLYEAESRLGGHTNTFVVADGEDEGTCVDTGFIVFNGETYPLFQRFLAELGVARQLSDMSFGYLCERTGWAYGGHDLNTFFARRRALFNPDFWRFALDIARFNHISLWRLANGGIQGTLAEYLRGYTGSFLRHYILPLGAAIWSAPLDEILRFPAQTYVRFFANHGLLRLTRRPEWFTVNGGSHQYLHAFRRHFQGRIHLNSPIQQLGRGQGGVEIRLQGESRQYEKAVLACHADQALALLAQPTPAQSRALGSWRYLGNRAVLHRDDSLLPARRRVRASWNYRRHRHSPGLPTLTYDMNRLQGLRTCHAYLVTLNPQAEPRQILGEWLYRHPQFDQAAVAGQAELPALNDGQLALCGSYHGFGFHEDAVRSAVAAAASLGVQWS